jgi:hypothetical protein
MKTKKLEALLIELLTSEEADEFSELDEASVKTFREAELLTDNRGVVLTLKSGEEFQIQVVRSKGAKLDMSTYPHADDAEEYDDED